MLSLKGFASFFDLFFEWSRVGKILARVQDKNQTSLGKTMVDLQ